MLRGSLTVEGPLQLRGERRLGTPTTAAHEDQEQQPDRGSRHGLTLTTSGLGGSCVGAPE